MSRLLRTVVAVAIVVGGLTACSDNKNNTTKDKVLRYIAATRATARAFAYKDEPLTGAKLDLVGVVADDYRYKVRFDLNGKTVREEVALDDALAVRFVDPETLGPAVDPDGLRKAQAKAAKAPAPEPGVESIPALPIDTLQAGRWVVDPVGAPSLAIRADQRNEGQDPVLDALTVLDYTAEVVRTSPGIVKFNIDALTPTYKDKEDFFEKPARGADVTRYDVPLIPFPRAAVTGGANKTFVPEANNFRKLAIFVKDEKVIRIDEDIDVVSRIKDFKKAFDINGDLQPEQAVAAINEVRKARGRKDILRPRRMTVSFPNLGATTSAIELPAPSDYTKGELSLLKGRGRLSARDRANAGTGSTATTAPAGDAAGSTASSTPSG
jgi:hypothetical protein